MTQILLATHNQGKLREMQSLLAVDQVQCVLPSERGVPADFDVAETGKTFAENALIKAKAFAEKTGMITLADDSGLEVDVLHGEPGVRSKRYVEGSDHDRNRKILDLLRFTQAQDRGAQFVTVLCLYDPKTQKPEYFEGTVKGKIAHGEQGSDGFGYDPIFIPDGYTQTFAELGLEIKNRLSHRAQALQAFKKYFVT